MCFILIITYIRNLTSASLIPIGDDTFRANVSVTSPTPDVDEDLFDDIDADKTYSPPNKEFKIHRPRKVYTASPVAGTSGLHLKKRKRTRTPSPSSSDTDDSIAVRSPAVNTPKTPRAVPSAKKTRRASGEEESDSRTPGEAPRPLSNLVHAPGYVNQTKNPIYDYFMRTKHNDDSASAKCIVILRLANDGSFLVCPHVSKQTRCSTSGPRAHLKGKHPDAHREWEKNTTMLAIKQKENAEALAVLKAHAEGLTPGKHDAKTNKAVIKHNVRSMKQLEFDMRITLLVCNAGLPFAFVDCEAYKDFWAWKDPEYHLKCAQTLSKGKLPLLYRQVEEALFARLQSEIKRSSAIGFTADGWSSKANDKYIGVTCHIINKNWEMERYVVHCGPQIGKSKGDLIAAKFDNIVEKLRLPAGTFKSMTTDNAANMLKAGRLSEQTDQHMGCFDHLIQLIVNHALKQPLLCPAVNQFKRLMRKVHFSSDLEDVIRKECINLNNSGLGEATEYCKLISYTETRWNSCLRMMRSIVKMRVPLESIRDSGNTKTPAALMECIPSSDEFNIVERLLPGLTIFEGITDFMQSETYPAIAFVCSKLQWLKKNLCDKCTLARNQDDLPLHQFYKTACDELDRRFPMCGTKNLIYAKASLLNPCIKSTVLYQTGELHTTKNDLLAKEDELFNSMEQDLHNEAILDEEDFDEEALYWRGQAEQTEGGADQLPTDRRPLRAELDLYLSTRNSIGKVKPHEVLDWWKQRRDQFPKLCEVVKNIYTIQATSCAVERTFSTGGLTVTAKRTKLKPENVHKIVFIRENYKKLNITKLITSNAKEKEVEKLIEQYD